MKPYLRYEVQERNYSSNVVLGVYETQNEKGERVEKKELVLCPVLPKADGDSFATGTCQYLNTIAEVYHSNRIRNGKKDV